MENLTIDDCKLAIITQVGDIVYQVVIPETLIKELIKRYGVFEITNPLSKRLSLKYESFNNSDCVDNLAPIKRNKRKNYEQTV